MNSCHAKTLALCKLADPAPPGISVGGSQGDELLSRANVAEPQTVPLAVSVRGATGAVVRQDVPSNKPRDNANSKKIGRALLSVRPLIFIVSPFWSAPAEQSGDGALDRRCQDQVSSSYEIQSGVAASLCHRTPNYSLITKYQFLFQCDILFRDEWEHKCRSGGDLQRFAKLPISKGLRETFPGPGSVRCLSLAKSIDVLFEIPGCADAFCGKDTLLKFASERQ